MSNTKKVCTMSRNSETPDERLIELDRRIREVQERIKAEERKLKENNNDR